MLQLESLTVRRGGHAVIKDATVTFSQGTTALVGRNGAGKSTLLLTALGLLEPSSGRVCFDRTDIRGSEQARRRFHAELGWVPQDAAFPAGLRVHEAVEYALWLKRLPRAEIAAHTASALDATDLHGLRDREARRLSGGERRRLALACAIAHRPRLLVLDEPTAGLDPHQRRRFHEALGALPEATTVILSTHIVEDIVQTADHLVALHSGRITFDGPAAELVPPGASSDAATEAVYGLLDRDGTNAS